MFSIWCRFSSNVFIGLLWRVLVEVVCSHRHQLVHAEVQLLHGIQSSTAVKAPPRLRISTQSFTCWSELKPPAIRITYLVMSKKLWVVPHNVLTNCAALRARGVAVVLSNFIHQHSDHLAAPLGRGSTTICGAKTISWGILACGISNTWYLLRRQTTGTTGCCDGLEQVGELVSKDEEDEKPELGCIF